MNETEAKKTAQKVRDFWAAKGVRVDVKIVSEPLDPTLLPKTGHHAKNVWGVWTNLKNGLPRERGLPMIRRKANPHVHAHG